ncbi:N-acetyltransferase [Streptomyces sp. SID5785]|uniref:GNAT family N-acetyltransferase n=1 Tax=Streptomyces sp. SID5785 TaxID=2690309 RepID=UPI0013615BD9|nr:GNAT family N-acetyltransferase [Streptomyces sp. SID5785]MZD10476.1 N-acetyltransferase [Streptomyces sp. SID5785]
MSPTRPDSSPEPGGEGHVTDDVVILDDRERGLLRARAGGPGGEVLGHIQYFVLDAPERALVAVHTIVEPRHEGRGIAGSLTRELYALAAREAVQVVPLCSFVVRWAARHPGEAPAVSDALRRAAEQALAADPGKW